MLPELPEPPAIMPPPASWAAAGAVCVWLVSCSTVSVVSPTVPETPGHHPHPRVYRGSDADHIMASIVRRQAAGGLGAGPGKAMRMGLRATDGAGGRGRLPDTSSPAAKTARGIPRTSHCMFMAGQLLHAQRRGADSAGNTRPPPPTPRLPPLRRGSHTARHSTAAGCRRPQS